MSYEMSTAQMPSYISIIDNTNGQRNKYSIEQFTSTKSSSSMNMNSYKTTPLRRFGMSGGAVQNKYDDDDEDDESIETMERKFAKSLSGGGDSSNIIELASDLFTEQNGGKRKASKFEKDEQDEDVDEDDMGEEDFIMRQHGGKGEALAIYRKYTDYVLSALKKKYGDEAKGGVPLQKLGGYYMKKVKEAHPNEKDMTKLTELTRKMFDDEGVEKAKKRYDQFVAERAKH